MNHRQMILLVAGARPNFMKIAPLIHELRAKSHEPRTINVTWKLVHTGQHYDYEMSKVFFKDFDIPRPHYFLNAGSGSHAEQTARVMLEFEKVCLKEKPDVVVVVGDVNSTLACSVTAKKLTIKVAHVEAGLRSRDMTMPEEINRIVTDSISDFLFVTEKSGAENLLKEGRTKKQIHFVGNIMIDTLFYSLGKLARRQAGKPKKTTSANVRVMSYEPRAMNYQPRALSHSPEAVSRDYAVVTLHRPSNVDDREKLEDILSALQTISRDMDIFFPVHPRTEKNIRKFRLKHLTKSMVMLPPQSYIDFLSLWKGAALVLTDSGGLQEETTALGIPCFTVRANTERPVTIEEGTNTLVGTTGTGILKAYRKFKAGKRKNGRVPRLWDGRTARRIVKVLSGASARK